LKRVERESFLKSFTLYFLSISTLLLIIYYLDIERDIDKLSHKIKSEMRICSYNLECDGFEIEFVEFDGSRFDRVERGGDGSLYSDFSIPGSEKYAMRVVLDADSYKERISEIKRENLLMLGFESIVVVILSLLFSWYTLKPLGRALKMTEEFAGDILHDFNTPLSTIRLNLSMITRKYGKTREVERIEKSVATILQLQKNLRSHLEMVSPDMVRMDLKSFIETRVESISDIYPNIRFSIDIPSVTIETDPAILTRIIDNLLTNAAKYSEGGSTVRVGYIDERFTLVIENGGTGIENPRRVFERFYRESDTGYGLGLNIVKKLCDSLNIEISLESVRGEKTCVYMDISSIITKRTLR